MASKQKDQQDQLDPALVRQIRQLMNLTSQVDPSILDQAGRSDKSQARDPYIQELLKMGYQSNEGGQNIMPTGWMSDQDAMGAAIQALRQGQTPRSFTDPKGKLGALPAGTAAENFLKYLVGDRTAYGIGQPQALQDIQQEVTREMGNLRTAEKTRNTGGSLTPDEQAAIKAESQGGGVPGGVTGASLASAIDKAAQNQINSYYAKGQEDINQYQANAALMASTIPKELQPIFQSQVSQRSQEMLDNLNLYKNKEEMAPFIDALTGAAKDYIKGPKASSSNALNQALSKLAGAQTTLAGGMSPIASNGPLTGRDLGNQLLEAMKWSQNMGTGYAKFAGGVDAGSQIANLKNFIPQSKTAWKTLPSYLSVLNK